MTLLAASAIDVTLVLAVGLTATALLKRRSAAFRHWILTATIVVGGAMPVLELLLPAWRVPLPASPATSSAILVSIDAVGSTGVDPVATPTEAVRIGSRWDLALLIVWSSGLLAALGVLGVGLGRLRRLIRRAEPVTEAKWRDAATATARELEPSRNVRMLYASHPTPVSLGWLQPTILLPADARNWDHDRIRVVLRHEFAHVARLDWPIQMAAAILFSVHWFNPLMWMAYRGLRRESERACDDLVLRSGIEPADYATHLLDMARQAGTQPSLWSPATAMAHATMLEERIQAMLDTRLNRDTVTTRARIAAAAVLVLLVLPIAGFTTAAPVREAGAAATESQAAPGSIVGVLYDQHNGLLPDVEISLTEDRTGSILTARSDQSGAFTFRDLPPGDYTLVTSLAGFARVRNLIRVASGASVKRNIMLPLGQVQETVSVVSDGTTSKATTRSSPALSREIPEPRVPSPCVGRIGGCIKPPRKVVDVRPVYPPGLAAAGVAGEVVLNGRIGIDGYMSDLQVVGVSSNEIESSTTSGMPHPDLVAAALEAVRQWEFNPTLLNGVPVEAAVTITVRFNTR